MNREEAWKIVLFNRDWSVETLAKCCSCVAKEVADARRATIKKAWEVLSGDEKKEDDTPIVLNMRNPEQDEKLKKLEALYDQAETAFLKYGRHLMDCPNKGFGNCACGFESIQARVIRKVLSL
jgi:hypothetical protein